MYDASDDGITRFSILVVPPLLIVHIFLPNGLFIDPNQILTMLQERDDRKHALSTRIESLWVERVLKNDYKRYEGKLNPKCVCCFSKTID